MLSLVFVIATFAACSSDSRVHWHAASRVRVIADAPTLATSPGWQNLGRVPRLTNAAFTIAAWTGRELLLWGGFRQRDCSREVSGGTKRPIFHSPAGCDHSPREGLIDGLALDPAEHQWRALPSPPLAAPLLYASAVWTGRELIIVGQVCWAPTSPDMCYPGGYAAVAYNPNQNRWATLPPPPSSKRPTHETLATWAAGWSGRVALFDVDGGLRAYDPTTQRWSSLGSAHRSPYVCTSEHRIIGLASDGDAGTQPLVFHFEVRADAKNSRWTKSTTFTPSGVLPDDPIRCTTTGASIVQRDLTAYVLDAATMHVSTRGPRGIHGNWYGIRTSFAPIAPDGGTDVDLPKITTAVFDIGRRVYAVANDSLVPCARPPCSTSLLDHIETLLRRPA